MKLQFKKAKAIELLRKQSALALSLGIRTHAESVDLEKWYSDSEAVVANIFGEDSRQLRRFQSARDGSIDTAKSVFVVWRDRLGTARALLNSMADEVVKFWPEDVIKLPNSVSQKSSLPNDDGFSPRRVFVVHGRDSASKEKVARFLEKLGLKAVILHEQANRGRTIIEKFEDYADVGFAVALLTADDVGKHSNPSETEKPRARQNVIFEFGYFIGRIGRDRVCALVDDGVERPSDMDGIVYVPLDPADAWQMRLVKELKEAGYNVDANKAL